MDIDFATWRTQIAQKDHPEASNLLFINGVIDRLRACGTDSNRLAYFINELAGNKQAFAEAMVTNTARATGDLEDRSRDGHQNAAGSVARPTGESEQASAQMSEQSYSGRGAAPGSENTRDNRTGGGVTPGRPSQTGDPGSRVRTEDERAGRSLTDADQAAARRADEAKR